MKKILIATAVAATIMSGSALAAGPTMYGKIHTSVDVMDNGGSGTDGTKYNETSLNSNGSRIGVKGSEDLGNGMKVGYLIEWELDMSGDGGDMNTRNRAIMLSGDWGTALAGKWDNPAKVVGRKSDLFGDQVGDLRNLTASNTAGVNDTKIDGRWENTIQYATPKVSGFRAAVAYSFDTDADKADNDVADSGDNQDNDAYALNVIYDNGPYLAGVGYEHIDGNGFPSAMDMNDQQALRVMAGYKGVENLDVRVSYTDVQNASFIDNHDTNVASVGAAYTMGNNKLKLQYAVRDDYADLNNSGADMLSVGVDHTMSKRTTVYAAYAMVNNDDMSGNTPWVAGGHDRNAVGSMGDDADAISLGIIHKF